MAAGRSGRAGRGDAVYEAFDQFVRLASLHARGVDVDRELKALIGALDGEVYTELKRLVDDVVAVAQEHYLSVHGQDASDPPPSLHYA